MAFSLQKPTLTLMLIKRMCHCLPRVIFLLCIWLLNHVFFSKRFANNHIFFFHKKNLDHPGLAMKSTRNSDNYNNHIDGSITPSTILVHGLLGEVCISDNDCSILNSICDNFTKRCACKKGTVPDALEKVCKVAERVVPPTMLISKYTCNTTWNKYCEICWGKQGGVFFFIE